MRIGNARGITQLKSWIAAAALTATTHSAAHAQYAGKALYPLALPGGYYPAITGSIGAGQAVGDSYFMANDRDHALVWTGPQGLPVDLNPAGVEESQALASDGDQQVGGGYYSNGPANQHAFLWSGTAASAVDLNPTPFFVSDALANTSNQQVGYGILAGNRQALLWSGTAASVVNLNPTNLAGFQSSSADGTDGTHQVGGGSGTGTGNAAHALLWSGTAGSAVDLNPTGFEWSSALGVGGNLQVGNGAPSNGSAQINHALVWSGTAASAVDLNPSLPGLTDSLAHGTNGIEEVGYGYADGSGNSSERALLWTGTAASAVDLQPLLPADGTWDYSQALSIDAAGNVYGIAIGSLNGFTGPFAVEWSAVPEPTTLSLLVIAGAELLARRRRSTRRRAGQEPPPTVMACDAWGSSQLPSIFAIARR